jgi:hypothetical protein
MSANGFQAGVSFLLVQVKHLSVNPQKITLAWCYRLPAAPSLRFRLSVRILFVDVELFVSG